MLFHGRDPARGQESGGQWALLPAEAGERPCETGRGAKPGSHPLPRRGGSLSEPTMPAPATSSLLGTRRHKF